MSYIIDILLRTCLAKCPRCNLSGNFIRNTTLQIMRKNLAGKPTQRKRLRQTSLDICFVGNKKPRNSALIDKTVEEEVVECVEVDEMSTAHISGSKLEQKRDILADAAEKRRNSASPELNLHLDKQSSPAPHAVQTTNYRTAPSSSKHNPDDCKHSPDNSRPGTSTAHNTDSTFTNRTADQKVTKPKTVFAYLEGIDSIGCNAGPSSSNVSPIATAVGSQTRVNTSHDTGRGGNKDDYPARTDSDVVDSPGECSETLEYDGSQPLFTDSDSGSQELGGNAPRSLAGEKPYWKGTPIAQLNQAPACRAPLPKLKPDQDHTVLFRPYVRPGDPPRPYPDQYNDKWDAYHVRMPCSPENLYPVEDKKGQKRVQSRWEIIETTLLNNIQNSYELEDAILTYNARYSKKWDFKALHKFFTEVLDEDESNFFFSSVLPGMVQLALQLPKLCTKAIPLLRRQQNHSISLTQQQIASLLANAFFCTYPRRNAQQRRSEYSTYPDINFNRLFEGTSSRKTAKIQCIVNYFRRVVAQTPSGTLTFTRRALKKLPRWDKSTATFTKLHTAASGMIEDEGAGMLQMDFANKFLGGGVLGNGCVQEEIRFLICPELLLSRLFTEVLDNNECLIIKGAERFSSYSGYASTFKWTGNFQDTTPRDKWGRMETEIVALDALVFHSYTDQFKPELIRRELNKAFCGFHGGGTESQHIPALATGNWGCGAFGGDTRVKALLQMMSAAECERQISYFTFGDKSLCDDLDQMHQFLVTSGVTVGDLWNTLQQYRQVISKSIKKAPKLYAYIYQLYSDYQSSTDDEEENKSVASLSPDYNKTSFV